MGRVTYQAQDLKGTTILITGASSGIGEAIAIAAADRGANVAISARSTSRLKMVADKIKHAAGSVKVLPADLRQRAQIKMMVDQTIEDFEGLDILINSAGVGHWKAISDADIDQWENEVEVNLVASMYATRFAVNTMLEQQSGHIVFISSMAGRLPGPDYPGYTATKAGLNAFADSIVMDLTAKGIKVTLIEPGAVDIPMQDEAARGQGNFLLPSDVADAVIYALTRPAHVCITNIALLRSSIADS